MGVLLDKDVSELPDEESKPFVVTLEKYKSVVVVKSIDVDEKDDCLLQIEFDHNIDAPEDEVGQELGRVILDMLEKGLNYMTDKATVEEVKE